jgi:hypothetical protein
MWWLIGGGSTVLALTLLVVLGVVVFALLKKRVDKKQEELSRVGWILEEKLGLEGATPIFAKLGSGNLFGAINAAKDFSKRWFTGDKIDDLVVRIIRKALPQVVAKFPEHRATIAKAIVGVLSPLLDDKDSKQVIAKGIADVTPKILDDKDIEKILEAVLLERITGFTLDPETKAKLAILTGPLSELGLEKFSTAIMGIATDNADLAKAQVQALVAELMTDVGRRAAMKRVLRKTLPEFAEVPEDRALALQWLGITEPATVSKM